VGSLRELVESPSLGPLLGYVSRPRIDPLVRGVALVEDLADLERASEQTIVLLTRGASSAVSSYRFDTALRVARSRGVAAIVLAAADVGRISTTAIGIANRSGTAILGTDNDVELTELALAIGRELAGDANVALLRAHTAVRAIESHPRDAPSESMLAHAGAALGVPLSMASFEPPDLMARPVVIDDRVEAWVTAPDQDGDMSMAVQIVLHVAAGSVADVLARGQREAQEPTQSREEVLTELLAASPRSRGRLVVRARSLGLPIDGWHIAVRLDFEDLADPAPGEELDAYQARARLASEALQAARAAGGTWHRARTDDAFLLITTYKEDPSAAGADEVAHTMDEVLAGMRRHLPGSLIRCGIGTAQLGPGGLLASVAEARAAALAARTSKRTNTVVPFDSIGLRRTLVEWYASDTAREAATSVLQPLLALGATRGERLIQTLHVYLDEQGSLTHTAQRMNLHRNAVAYRINRAFELLDVDRDSPDDLLLLQLACRARELT
jgi:sugar diacid utilization regulator